MNIEFVAGFGPIARDMEAEQAFYGGALGLPLEGDASYLHTRNVQGITHFGVWPLREAAASCFGSPEWPADVPAPQGWMEFDVQDVEGATRELRDRGYRILVAGRQEPWGQTVTRLLGPEGLLVGITYTPDLRSPQP